MTIKNARSILLKRGIFYVNYFDLSNIKTNDTLLREAIDRIKTFITIGR